MNTDFIEGPEGNKGDGKNAKYAKRTEAWELPQRVRRELPGIG
jgi:hypothetical protein